MSKTKEPLYDKKHIDFLEKLWGEGYLSPGGKKEVNRLLQNIDISDKIVLDIGCGSGGITASLATDFEAKNVIGIDVEEDVCALARSRVSQAGLQNKVNIIKVSPGAFPFRDLNFD